MLREKFFHQTSNFYVVSSQTGKILHQQGGSSVFFQLLHHIIKARAVHGNTGNAVINEGNDNGISQIFCGFRQQLLLISDAVTFTIKIIVTG